jgi:Uma2 family endonuclease
VLRDKMEEWLASGVCLAWLIDPESRIVEIYLLNLAPVWDPLD